MGVKRKQHSAEFKARVAVASLSGGKTLAELSAQFGVHPTMISNWKQELVKRAGQGAQFISDEFTKVQWNPGNEISMDGRGRCHDNIFVERLRHRTPPPACLTAARTTPVG